MVDKRINSESGIIYATSLVQIGHQLVYGSN